MGLVLVLIALLGITYSIAKLRSAALGDELIDACAGSYETAVLAARNVRSENELLHDLVMRGIAIKRIDPQDLH